MLTKHDSGVRSDGELSVNGDRLVQILLKPTPFADVVQHDQT